MSNVGCQRIPTPISPHRLLRPTPRMVETVLVHDILPVRRKLQFTAAFVCEHTLAGGQVHPPAAVVTGHPQHKTERPMPLVLSQTEMTTDIILVVIYRGIQYYAIGLCQTEIAVFPRVLPYTPRICADVKGALPPNQYRWG